MEFEYTGHVYVSNSDLEAMCALCNTGVSPRKAADIISAGWDDGDYYAFDYIVDQLVEEIEKRLNQSEK